MTHRLTNEELQVEIESAGYRLVPRDHATELETLAKRIDGLTLESGSAHAAAITTRDAISALSDDMHPLMKELRKLAYDTLMRVSYLESAKAAHAQTLTEHASKHTQHEDAITGVIKRLVVVEETVTKRTGLRRKKRK